LVLLYEINKNARVMKKKPEEPEEPENERVVPKRHKCKIILAHWALSVTIVVDESTTLTHLKKVF
jgi:hypothetical protein